MCCPPVQFLDPTRSFCRFSSSLRGFFFEGYFGNLHAVRYQLSLWGGSCRKERKIKVMDHRPEKNSVRLFVGAAWNCEGFLTCGPRKRRTRHKARRMCN